MDLAKAHVVVYHNILDEFDMAWCVEGLIATRNNVMIIWKIGPRMGIVSWLYAMLTLIGGQSHWTTPTIVGHFSILF